MMSSDGVVSNTQMTSALGSTPSGREKTVHSGVDIVHVSSSNIFANFPTFTQTCIMLTYI